MPTVVERQKDPSELGLVNSFLDQSGRIGFAVLIPLLSRFLSSRTMRYNRRKNKISIHGESDERMGVEEINRTIGKLSTLTAMIFLTGMVYLVEFSDFVIGYSESSFAAVFSLIPLILSVVCVSVAVGSLQASDTCEYIDHTTEPLPQELESLQQQFVDGDLDEHELADRVEAVIDR